MYLQQPISFTEHEDDLKHKDTKAKDNSSQKAPKIVWISSDEEDAADNSEDSESDNGESSISIAVSLGSPQQERLTEQMRGMSCKSVRLFNLCAHCFTLVHRDVENDIPHTPTNAKPGSASLPPYPSTAMPPQTPPQRQMAIPTPSAHTSMTRSTPEAPALNPSPAPATPGRRGIFNAYVVYSGKTPYYYAQWSVFFT